MLTNERTELFKKMTLQCFHTQRVSRAVPLNLQGTDNSCASLASSEHREIRKDSKNLVRKSEVVKEGMPQTDQLIDKPSANLTQDPGENRNPLLKQSMWDIKGIVTKRSFQQRSKDGVIVRNLLIYSVVCYQQIPKIYLLSFNINSLFLKIS